MTRAYETTSRRYVELTDVCRDPSCGEHPHCPFDGCGAILLDDGTGVLRCPERCADALAGSEVGR